MLVISPTAPHLHPSSINMLETGKPAISPSTSPRSRQSDMPSPTSGLDQSLEPASPRNPVSSTLEVVRSPGDVEADPYQYVPAGTPGRPSNDEDGLPGKTEIPLLTTFPAKVPLSVLPDLASSAGDCEGMGGKSLNSDVVSALISEDSTNEGQSFESVDNSAMDSMMGENGLNQQELSVKDRLLVRATQSMPVSMSSSPRTPILRDDAGKPLHIISGEPPEDSVHLIQNIYAHSVSLTSEDSVVRSKSMPLASSQSSQSSGKNLTRSSTENERRRKKGEEASIRIVGEPRLSNRRKKKLLRKLATIKKDGAVEFDMTESSQAAKDLFGFGFTPRVTSENMCADYEQLSSKNEEFMSDHGTIPPLKIVMLIVGTRGDVQPFIAIGKRLQEHGHRVRLASHKNFENFVKREGLEFYPLGGDPVVLAGYMVKNKGFLPSNPSEIPVQREQIKSIVYSLLAACTMPDLDTGIPFEAQAIIANPPAYGHVHVAEYLKIPLHIFFTMPWTPTSAFPHPLSRVKQPAAYRMSYSVVDTLIWLGIRGIVNSYRKKKLKLRPITYLSGSQGSISEMPTGYIWSPHLVPKPRDWGPLVDVVGFCFLNLASDYKPPEDLVKFLQAGPPPIYIGFGSLPVEDPQGMTKIIVEAINKTGQRGIIGKGWGGIGDLDEVPENIFLLSDCPHDWLFPQCAAVVHHGGAGTTSAGLKAACPTTIIPFFGDQPFWGDRVHEKGVGPVPIPVNYFTLEKLISAIEFMLDPAVKQKAVELAKAMEFEDGVEGAVNAFHKHIWKELPQIVCNAPQNIRRRKRSMFKGFFDALWIKDCFFPS
ncbi:hypothetical protein KC19_6G201900 [Ceratodon purpureus]|uniref:sterol 3beta-glucosyltransferase n=1 Tax=Ceratodon purpureus TaxID=3225 RepID=A0A8T0HJK7_CERPU|nr:hypothetical protein KC19_6G201900 [Ceratodon purpureus]